VKRRLQLWIVPTQISRHSQPQPELQDDLQRPTTLLDPLLVPNDRQRLLTIFLAMQFLPLH
jgi:hypothetical protein